jgi:peptide subunit release factor 1 (eRF1)
MLDTLLGRSALKERIGEQEARIEELEADIERLEAELESETERRADAVTARQDAQHRANKLEDRVEQLEDLVDRLQAEETTLSFRRQTEVAGRTLEEVLDRLDSVETGPQGALTAYVRDGHDLPAALREAFGERAALVSRAAPCLAVGDDEGLVAACLRPPVDPDPFTEWGGSFRIDRGWFLPRGRYTLALVRSDLFAMGTYQGDERTAFHGFDSDLKSQHSKGGFSQARFERLRDEQVGEHLDRCQAALDERETERLYVVGEHSVLGEFMHLADATAAVDATGDPEDALRDAWESFWSVPFQTL